MKKTPENGNSNTLGNDEVVSTNTNQLKDLEEIFKTMTMPAQ